MYTPERLFVETLLSHMRESARIDREINGDHGLRGSMWWYGEMPDDPGYYDPEDWEEANSSIEELWDRYISDVREYVPQQLASAKVLRALAEWVSL